MCENTLYMRILAPGFNLLGDIIHRARRIERRRIFIGSVERRRCLRNAAAFGFWVRMNVWYVRLRIAVHCSTI